MHVHILRTSTFTEMRVFSRCQNIMRNSSKWLNQWSRIPCLLKYHCSNSMHKLVALAWLHLIRIVGLYTFSSHNIPVKHLYHGTQIQIDLVCMFVGVDVKEQVYYILTLCNIPLNRLWFGVCSSLRLLFQVYQTIDELENVDCSTVFYTTGW